VSSAPKSLPPGVRVFEDEPAGTVEIGRGTFGVCFLAKLGPLKCCKDGNYIPAPYLIMLWEDYNQMKLRKHRKRVSNGNRQYVYKSSKKLCVVHCSRKYRSVLV